MASLNAETSAPAAPVRTAVDRWVLPNERLLWALVVCAFALDVVTTATGLAIGLDELNPIAASLLAAYGIVSLVGLKVVALAIAGVCRAMVPDRVGAAVPLGLVLPSGGAVLVNSVSIAVAL